MKNENTLRWLLPLLVVVANLFVIALVAYSLFESRQLQEQRALVQTQNLATILEQNLTEKLRSIDLALRSGRDEFERQQAAGGIDPAALDTYLSRLQARLPELDGLRITDAAGNIRYGQGVNQHTLANLADRDYFRCTRDGDKARRCLGQPVISRVTGKWITALAYRLEDRRGNFGGMVYATIRIAELTRLFAELEMGRHGSLILRDHQARLITRYPEAAGPAGEVGNAKVSPEFRSLLGSGQQAGSYKASNTSDGIARIHTFHRLSSADWIVVAGLAEDEYLASWRDQRDRYIAVALIFLAASLFAMRLLGDYWRQQIENAEQLRRARDAADAANRAKSQFLAVMSHELRTPLNGVLGMAQILMMPDITDQERIDYAQTINHSGLSLQTLLNDILDLSKIEAGRMELQVADFHPEQLLHESAQLFADAAGKKGLSITVDIGSLHFSSYRGDPLRLRQILINLVNNAVKFTEQGGIRLQVCDAPAGNGLRFSVCDSGIGIPPDKQAALFQPFSQVDDSFTRRYGGTGLGLAISRNLLQLMGGEIELDSEPGRGTCFTFTLPAPPGNASADLSPVSSAPPASEAPSPPPAAILLVDDNRVNRKVVRTLLEKHGFAVSEAEDGEQALAQLATGPFSLVLMDCQMPVMDGYSATRALRQREATEHLPHLPVIALTAAAFENDREQCAAAGMDDFLSKPVVAEQLFAAIKRWQR
ncbi:ATP-binding protein [Dechloromonas sp. ZY10]|uniref:hybrid sensor histidine kinase/response regulator n=1 Tax=Dechloromonas aquae TaxID=2664436 RepID=UPI003529B367